MGEDFIPEIVMDNACWQFLVNDNIGSVITYT